MIKALEIPLEIDLASFSGFLRARGLQHRVSEEGVNQVLWVAGEQELRLVQAAYAQYQAGELNVNAGNEAGFAKVQAQAGSWIARALVKYPFTLSLIAITFMLFPLGFGIDQGQYGLLFSKMTFLPMDRFGDGLYFASLSQTLASGEIWRLVTPMFIHFGALHIVFNLLWVWEIGRRIEFVNGALMFVALVLLTSVTANMTQYLMSGPSLFGGMSGVVFGLLGHSLLWSAINPERSTGVPKGIYIFMLVYLGVGFTGAIDLLGMGNLANGAHLGGLVAGAVMGATAGLLARRRSGLRSR